MLTMRRGRSGSPFRCSITGGHVYRGPGIPEIQGRYFFADWCSDEILSLVVADGFADDVRDHTAEFAPGGGLNIRNISSFGEDTLGEVYICDRDDGEVFKIVHNPPLPDGDGGRRIPTTAPRSPTPTSMTPLRWP